MTVHVIVDMIYDFIDGSLACSNAEIAIENAVKYINEHPEQKVVYVCDSHPKNHCSFKENGGIWPAHCVKETRGAAIHTLFNSIEVEENRPNISNIYRKGENPDMEEYSGYNAVNAAGERIKDIKAESVIVSGIATEYCVKESVLALKEGGFNVTLLKDNLAYVDYNGHLATIEELMNVVTVK